jgi:hypothetical protein
MGQKSDQIERHIRETRNELSENFSELEEKVKSAVDWRTQFEERPGTMLALAFGGGVLLSAIFSSRRSSTRQPSESRWSSEADRDNSRSYSRGSYGQASSPTSETWNALKGAIIGAATTKLSGVIEEFLPGFSQEFKTRGGQTADEPGSPTGSSTYNQAARQKSAAAGAD